MAYLLSPGKNVSLKMLIVVTGLMQNETVDLLVKKGSRITYQPSLPRTLHKTIHGIKSKMDHVY